SARAKAQAEAGQVVLENVAIVPLALLFCLIAWQLVLTGVTFMYMGHAADEGARAAAIGKPASVVTREATEALPASMRSGATVTRPSPSSVQVSLPVPLVVPGWVSVSRITTEQKVVVEP
ncbi:hypothetical protein, partial [Kribbia dieselivorans]|uniref:hypothetical protein n=1 Tax=Kribbia dieselivorans TaxID=331526 RepID=UPI0008397959